MAETDVLKFLRERTAELEAECENYRVATEDVVEQALRTATEATQHADRAAEVTSQRDATEKALRAANDALLATQERLERAETNLQETNEELETTNAELEASNEELQASNEELETTNEELQASNEELETTNEELQASNEELLASNDALALEAVVRKRAEKGLIEAKSKAEFANRSKTEFLTNMSHELRTPLAIINGSSEILSTEMFGPIDNPKYLEYGQNILEAGKHLLDLVNEILDISRIEMDRLDLKEDCLNVEKVLSACHTLIKGRAFEGGLAFDLKIEDGLSPIRGDEQRIKQILLNLLSNAIRFTPRGGTVTLKAQTDGPGRLAVAVTDTGIGIAPKNQARVLEAFGQVESVYSRENQGAGIGLPLSKKLIELHGGTLKLESELGVGTTVTVDFPPERVLSE